MPTSAPRSYGRGGTNNSLADDAAGHDTALVDPGQEPELLILLVLAGLLFATFYGAYRAFKNGDTAWLIGILAAWLVALGWLVGIVYLVAVDGHRRTA